jgi:regulator of cell morphogenesis and NO signaling
MNELRFKPLSQIVNEHHQTASVFEKYNLDYCCKGNRSLLQACNDSDIPLNEVATELILIYDIKKNELDYNEIKLYQLADYIVYTHHAYIKKETAQILSYLEKVSSKHGNTCPELHKIAPLVRDLFKEIAHHMHHEETIIFPRIKQLAQSSFEPISGDKYFEYLVLPIIDMEDELEDAGNMMREIRKLTHNYVPPANACTTFKLLYKSLHAFEIDLHLHVHLENSILFPKALILEKELKISLVN